ncbi:Cullin binding-domain-containing protein [Lipomyces oligophaga]|uniref:Cullin binding-domain-containing protein n=1 Tax=Lipomyces oligophaga TaxID=45792 RepID=UPI0034CD521F
MSALQRNAVNLFIQATGASNKTANQYLRSHSWNLDAAVSEFLDSNANRTSSKKQIKALTEIFEKYIDEEDPSIIGIDGTISFVQDLGMDVEDPSVLALVCKLEAPTVGQFSKDGFIKGWQSLGVDSFPKMKSAAESLKESMLTDPDFFKQVYRYTFTFIKPSGQRNLPLDLAVEYWNLLLKDRFASPELFEKWIHFARDVYKRVVSKDTWNMLYEFNESVLKSDSGLESYDPEAAWPSIFDEFVTFLKA